MDAKTAPPNGGTELERVIDGSFANLTFLIPDPAKPDDPSARIKSEERVKIKKISIQRMDALANAWGNFPKEVAVYIDRPFGSFELEDDSFETAFQEGRRLNFTSFEKWYRWQVETLKGLGQENGQQQVSAVAEEIVRTEMQRRLSAS